MEDLAAVYLDAKNWGKGGPGLLYLGIFTRGKVRFTLYLNNSSTNDLYTRGKEQFGVDKFDLIDSHGQIVPRDHIIGEKYYDGQLFYLDSTPQ